jgi:hypothetical protein
MVRQLFETWGMMEAPDKNVGMGGVKTSGWAA